MGRWTPLILMAGGLAILIGTLLGITFPIDGQQNAKEDMDGKDSRVLPANINVNSTATSETQDGVLPRSMAQSSGFNATPGIASNNTNSPIDETNQINAPIRALW